MLRTTGVMSTTASPFSAPRRKSLKHSSFIVRSSRYVRLWFCGILFHRHGHWQTIRGAGSEGIIAFGRKGHCGGVQRGETRMNRTEISLKRRGLMIAGVIGGAVPGLLVSAAPRARDDMVADASVAAHRAVISGRVMAIGDVPVAHASIAFRYSVTIEDPAIAWASTDADG